MIGAEVYLISKLNKYLTDQQLFNTKKEVSIWIGLLRTIN